MPKHRKRGKIKVIKNIQRRCITMLNFSDDVKKVFLAGIGAAATTAEKAKELVDQLVKNEELKHAVKEKLRTPVDAEGIKKDLEKVSKEELAAIKEKIEELQAKSDEEDK